MKNKLLSLFFLIIAFTSIFPQKIYKILVIHSYEDIGNYWVMSLNKGIYETFSTADIPVAIHTFYFNETGQDKNERFFLFETLVLEKKLYQDVDLIITCDNYAFEKVALKRKEYFGDKPFVFLGVNDFFSIPFSDTSNITGLPEIIPYKETFDLIFSLHENAKSVYVVVDSTLTGKKIFNEISKLEEKYNGVKFIYLIENFFSRINYKLNFIEPEAPVFFAAKFFSDDGKFLPYEFAYSEILKSLPNPAYSCWDVILGKGIVGGYFISGVEHGNYAAKLALDILKKGKVERLLPVRQIPKLKIDYLQAVRKKINLQKINEEIIFINRENVFLAQDYLKVILILVLAVFTFGGLIFLYFFRKKISQLNFYKKQNTEYFFKLFESAPFAAVITDFNNNIIYWNAYLANLSGYTSEEICDSPKNLYDFIKIYEDEKLVKFEKPFFYDDARLYSLVAKSGSLNLLILSQKIFEVNESKYIIYWGKEIDSDLSKTEKLEEIENNLKYITSYLNESIFIFAKKIGDNYKIVLANSALRKLVDLKEEDFKGLNLSVLGEEFIAIVEQFLRSSQTYYSRNSYNFSIVKGNGSSLYLEVKLYKLDNKIDSDGLYFLIIINDLTEEKNKEKQHKSVLNFYEKQKYLLAKLSQIDLYDMNGWALSIEILCKEAAEILDVERASLWFFDNAKSKIVCYKMYDSRSNSFSSGEEIYRYAYPMYFHFIQIDKLICSEFAQKDPRTKELNETYLKPAGIVSMMDVGILIRGELVGIICFEKTKAIRNWSKEEQEFALELSNFAALLFAARERNLLEQNLKESETKYKNLVDLIPDGIFIIQNGFIKFANEKFLARYGYSLNETLDSRYSVFFNESDIETHLFAESEAEHKQKNVKFRSNFKSKKGILIPIEIQAINVVYRQQESYILYVKDLSETLNIQYELKRNIDRINAILKSLPDLIFILDLDGNIVDYHVSNEKLLAVEPEKAKNLNVRQLFEPELANLMIHKIRYSNLTREVQTIEYSINVKGEMRFFEARYAAIDKDLTMAICRDITEQKNSLEKIALLNSAVEQASVSIFITNSNGIIEYVNKKTLETSGYSKEEILGKTPRVFSSGLMPRSFYKNLWEEILQGNEWRGEILNKKKNGETFWEMVLISPVKNNKNQITHFVAVKEDITERKKLISELTEARNKAVESDRLKANLLANLSHEFRTPLNGIIGSVEIILDEYGDSELIRSIYNNIVFSSKRLLFTLDSILKFSQLENEIIKLYIKPCSSKIIFQDVIEEYKRLSQSKNVKIIIDEVDDFVFQADSELLTFAFRHLLDNAVKFNKNGGSVSIKIKMADNFVKIIIKDSGIGIDENYMNKIFSAFTQASEGLDRKYEGSGLGLAIVKRIANLMNGDIKIESQKDVGTTAILSIPFLPSFVKLKEYEEKETIFIDEFKPKVLLIEDNQINSFLVVKMLEDKYNITVAYTGEEAIELASRVKFDVVLCDINLAGGMDGLETMKQIRKLPDYANTPFGAITGYTTPSDKERFLKEGFDDYLGKPFDKKDLLKLMDNLTRVAY